MINSCPHRSPWPRRRRFLRFAIGTAIPVSAAALILTACGGSSSCVRIHDGTCLLEPDYQELAEEIAGPHAERSSFRSQWGLESIRADEAYAHLELRFGPDVAPGDGVTVGVLDSGIDTAHPHFQDKNIVERFLTGAVDEDGTEFSHGTAVASIIAGEDIPGFDLDAQGVAWGADLVVFAMPLGTAPELYEPIELSELSGAARFFAEAIGEITDWQHGSRSIDFLNLSLGVSGIIENYSEEVLREHFEPTVAAIAQEGVEDKVILVWAAGNSNGVKCDIPISQCVDGAVEASSVELLTGLAARFPELRENTVGVVAIRPEDGLIADFSNHCGIAADFCLAAPGQHVQVAYFGPGPEGEPSFRASIPLSGTSFAAPMVTGGLALMKQYFRSQVSNTDLLARLLETAGRSGPYADASIYGRGLLDLGAATSPVDEPVVALGNRVNGPSAALHRTSLQAGPAFGDAFAASLAHRELAAFDRLGAPFWYDAGNFTAAASEPSLSARLRDFQRTSAEGPQGSAATGFHVPLLRSTRESAGALPAVHLAKSGSSAAARASHFALADRGLVATVPVAANLTATAITSEGIDGQEPATGATLAWRTPDAPLGLRAGWMGERRSLLGSVSEGAFGDFLSNAVFAGIEADADVGRWRIGGRAEIGAVNARVRDGLFEDVSPVATSAFALHATRPTRDGGAFRVSLSQPLRVEDGEARLSHPSGRTIGGEVLRSAVAVDVEPSGRQVDLALQWRQPLELGELRLGAILSHEPGHRDSADNDLIFLSGWRVSF